MSKTLPYSSRVLIVPAPCLTVHLGQPSGDVAGLIVEKTSQSVLRISGKSTEAGVVNLLVDRRNVSLQIPKGFSAQQVAKAITDAFPKYAVTSIAESKQATLLRFSLPI